VSRRSVLDVWMIAPLCLMGENGMLDVLKIVRRQGKSSKTTWSNRFLVGLWHIISLNFLTLSKFVDFFFLLAFKGDFLCIHHVY
jgi:hypothetical protein